MTLKIYNVFAFPVIAKRGQIKMGKQPAFQWYPNDYLRDTRMLTLSARGAWADMLNFMWYAPERGKLEGSREQLARQLSCAVDELQSILDELSVTKVANVTNCNGIVTVINRRMWNEEKERKSTRLRVRKFRNSKSNTMNNKSVTPPSSSSSSSSTSKQKEKIEKKKKFVEYSEDFLAFWGKYPNKTEKPYAFNCWKRSRDKPPLDEIIAAIDAQIKWREEASGEFRPEWKNPATWINKGCWADMPTTEKTKEWYE